MPRSQPGSATADAAAAHGSQLPSAAYERHNEPEGGGTLQHLAPDPEGGTYSAAPSDTHYDSTAAGTYNVDSSAEEHQMTAAHGAGYVYGAAAGDQAEWAADSLAALHTSHEGTADTHGNGGVAATSAPAEYLSQLEVHLSQLQQQRQDLQHQLAAAAAAAYQSVSQRLGTASSSVPLPAEPTALVEELAVLQAVRLYLQYVQELQALLRHVDKAARSLAQLAQRDHSSQADGSAAPNRQAGAAFLQSASEAVDAFSTAVGYAIAVKQMTDQGRVPIDRLQHHALRLLAHVDTTQRSLRELLSAAIQRRLAAAHWPPALAAGGDERAAAGEDGHAWRGFAGGPGGAEALEELQQLLVVVLTLQRACQHEQFGALSEADQEVPLLWVAEELAAPISLRLRHHFASGLPTDRPDRPEWLFATALKAAQQCSPLVQELQPVIEAHSLQPWYSLPLELCRAIEVVGVNALLAEHVLPLLFEAGDHSLWLHLVDEAMQFERRLAVLRGAGLGLPGDEEFLAAAHPDSVVELLFQQPEWQEGWLRAELWDASRQLDAACDAYAAWHPAAEQLLAVAGQEEDLLPGTPRASGTAAWRREFWPPVCAEAVASLVGGLVRRGGWVQRRAHKLQYMRGVPLEVLRLFRDRIRGLLQQAEQFRGMLGDTWLPRVGAAINAAHYIEHQLREPQGVLLLVELQDQAMAAEAATVGKEAGGQSAGGAAEGGGDGQRSLASLVEREAAAFASLRKQWAYKLAKQAVDRFHQLMAAYKRDGARFAAGFEEGVPAEQGASELAAAGPPAASSPMLVAADSLQQLLRSLAQKLDAIVFRDVWRSVALAVNYSLYNDVATEALFSPQGAAQLGADLAAMVAVFGEYTSRPAAHFKETREACRLLQLPHDMAAQLWMALGANPESGKEVLAAHGMKVLNAEQAAVVLSRRLDLLPGADGSGMAPRMLHPAAGGSVV